MKKEISYNGLTATTNKNHMKQHNGIKFHNKTVPERSTTGKQMLENGTVLARSNNRTDIALLQALLSQATKSYNQ